MNHKKLSSPAKNRSIYIKTIKSHTNKTKTAKYYKNQINVKAIQASKPSINSSQEYQIQVSVLNPNSIMVKRPQNDPHRKKNRGGYEVDRWGNSCRQATEHAISCGAQQTASQRDDNSHKCTFESGVNISIKSFR